MPRKIGTENWRKKRRQEHLEMKEYRYYIFCDTLVTGTKETLQYYENILHK